MADPREIEFQNDVIAGLEAQGWLVGESDCYDKARALYPEDVVGFFSEAFPDEWEKFQKRYPQDSEKALLDSVARELGKRGTLDVAASWLQGSWRDGASGAVPPGSRVES